MKEYIVELYPKNGGYKTQTRVFAPSQSAALATARKQYPAYRTGNVKSANQ